MEGTRKNMETELTDMAENLSRKNTVQLQRINNSTRETITNNENRMSKNKEEMDLRTKAMINELLPKIN